MTPAARIAAAIEILDEITGGQAAEQALTRWARRSRFAGSKDRAAVRDHVFEALRHWRSDAARGGGRTGRARMIGRLRAVGADLEALFSGEGHGPAPLTAMEQDAGREPEAGAEALDLPDWLWAEMRADDRVDLDAVAHQSKQRAPVTLRANMRQIRPEALQAALLDEGITASPNPRAKAALTVRDGARRLQQSRAFAEGLFEMQDASSQAVVEALPPSARALDYCAGGGGKSLALAAIGARVTAHDRDPGRMRDVPERATRAGCAIELARTAEELSGRRFDVVLCDAPCSGSGAWRRQPEAKWTLTPERLAELQQIQGDILDQAMGYLSDGGILAYATCSVLSCENEGVVEAFLARHSGWQCAFHQRWLVDAEGDGFFTAHLTRE